MNIFTLQKILRKHLETIKSKTRQDNGYICAYFPIKKSQKSEIYVTNEGPNRRSPLVCSNMNH